MYRSKPVSALGHRAYVDHFDIVPVRLGQDSLDYILSGGDIHLEGLFRIIVSLRGHHAPYMKHIIGTLDPLKYIPVIREVSPNYPY